MEAESSQASTSRASTSWASSSQASSSQASSSQASTSQAFTTQASSSHVSSINEIDSDDVEYNRLAQVLVTATQLSENIISKLKELSDKRTSTKADAKPCQAANKLRRTSVNASEYRRTSIGLLVPIEQPMLLEGAVLKEHQMEGLEWLRVIDLEQTNGILGDEMGLGKTIQTISMICFLIENGFSGPFIILAPLSVLPTWVEQFEQFAPQVPVVKYCGNSIQRKLCLGEVQSKRIIGGLYKVHPVLIASHHAPLQDSALQTICWRYLVVDEGHRLKNKWTKLYKTLCMWKTCSRLLLTGTPLQNSLNELWSLLNFIMPHIFGHMNICDEWLDARDLTSNQEEAIERVLKKEEKLCIASRMRVLLEPFLLRRLKSEVNLNLPSKTETVFLCPMTQEQSSLQELTLNPQVEEFVQEIPDESGKRKKRKCALDVSYKEVSEGDEFMKVESANKENTSHECNLPPDEKSKTSQEDSQNSRLGQPGYHLKRNSMTLRHIANHPALLGNKSEVSVCEIERSPKLVLLDQMLAYFKAHRHKVLIFTSFIQIIDAIANLFHYRGYKFCVITGLLSLDEREKSIKLFQKKHNILALIMTTRTGGMGLNLTTADTVVFYDSDWNPFADLQAEARCHRIGQVNPVAVYRLIVQGTIDVAMLKRANGKQRLSDILLSGSEEYSVKKRKRQQITSDSQTRIERLKELLYAKEEHLISPLNGKNFSEDELETLLDRYTK